jgi:hypothetical protein
MTLQRRAFAFFYFGRLRLITIKKASQTHVLYSSASSKKKLNILKILKKIKNQTTEILLQYIHIYIYIYI